MLSENLQNRLPRRTYLLTALEAAPLNENLPSQGSGVCDYAYWLFCTDMECEPHIPGSSGGQAASSATPVPLSYFSRRFTLDFNRHFLSVPGPLDAVTFSGGSVPRFGKPHRSDFFRSLHMAIAACDFFLFSCQGSVGEVVPPCGHIIPWQFCKFTEKKLRE